jgi:DNA-binding LytR/AlgR family response regulator
MKTHLVISTANELLRVAATHIIYISSDGNYSNLLMSGGEIRMVTFQLGQIEEMIQKQLPEMRSNFIRIGRSLIININHVFHINIARQQLLLKDRDNTYTLSASKEALKALKEFIEKNI